MRIDTFYSCRRVIGTRCANCGKAFDRSPEWTYGINNRWYCGWNCYRRGEAERDRMRLAVSVPMDQRKHKREAEPGEKTYRLSDEDKQLIRELRADGLTIGKISVIVDRNPKTIQGFLRTERERGENNGDRHQDQNGHRGIHGGEREKHGGAGRAAGHEPRDDLRKVQKPGDVQS